MDARKSAFWTILAPLFITNVQSIIEPFTFWERNYTGKRGDKVFIICSYISGGSLICVFLAALYGWVPDFVFTLLYIAYGISSFILIIYGMSDDTNCKDSKKFKL